MNSYIIKEMLRHLVVRVVLSATFIALRQRRSPREYNIDLIWREEREIITSAAIIGIVFGVLTTWLVVMIKGDDSILIVIAGILLSIGLSQQVMSISLDAITVSLNGFISSWNSVFNLLAKQRAKAEWRFIENETHQIFINPHVIYLLPSELDEPKPSMEKITKYLDEHRWELKFPLVKLYHDEPSLLSFSQHSIEYLRDRLHVADRLFNIQQRSGAVNPVMFIALGTLIWLLS